MHVCGHFGEEDRTSADCAGRRRRTELHGQRQARSFGIIRRSLRAARGRRRWRGPRRRALPARGSRKNPNRRFPVPLFGPNMSGCRHCGCVGRFDGRVQWNRFDSLRRDVRMRGQTDRGWTSNRLVAAGWSTVLAHSATAVSSPTLADRRCATSINAMVKKREHSGSFAPACSAEEAHPGSKSRRERASLHDQHRRCAA